MICVALYAAISATKMIAYENFFYHLDEDAIHVAFTTISIAFIVYILVFTRFQKKGVKKRGQWDSTRMVVEHHKVCLLFEENIAIMSSQRLRIFIL